MPCPFCGGPVEDENCVKCGSLEGFTDADTSDVERKPSKMIAMSEEWTERCVMTEHGAVGTDRSADSSQPQSVGVPGGAQTAEEIDDEDVELFESSCVDNSLRVVGINVNGHVYQISQEMEPDDLAPIFSDVWTGSQVWRCSIVSSVFMSDLYAGRRSVKGPIDQSGAGANNTSAKSPHRGIDGVDLAAISKLRCIELGSGCGLLPIHAARLGMSCVVATDQTAMVRLANHNIQVGYVVMRECVSVSHRNVTKICVLSYTRHRKI